jgi:hypothetical protein
MDFTFISPKTINPFTQQTFLSDEAARAQELPLDRLASPSRSAINGYEKIRMGRHD